MSNNYPEMPKIWFGTWQIKDENCIQSVQNALELGYKHIDTAIAYWNEEEVWKWIKNSNIPREEIFLTTKIWMDSLKHQDVIDSVNWSLERLQTNYLDLILIHRPSNNVPLKETLEAMKELQNKQKVRYIWVSNFTTKLLKDCIDILGENSIYANQVEYHIFLDQSKLLNFCREHNIKLVAYSPLAHWNLIQNDKIKEIAEKYQKTTSQVALKWLIQQENVYAIPRSQSYNHIKENFQIFDFELDETDFEKLNNLPKNKRVLNPPFAPEWD